LFLAGLSGSRPGGQGFEPCATDPTRKFELMARFYAPKKELFDKAWKLPDVEKVSSTIGSGGK
jgi:hypothetical protein